MVGLASATGPAASRSALQNSQRSEPHVRGGTRVTSLSYSRCHEHRRADKRGRITMRAGAHNRAFWLSRKTLVPMASGAVQPGLDPGSSG